MRTGGISRVVIQAPAPDDGNLYSVNFSVRPRGTYAGADSEIVCAQLKRLPGVKARGKGVDRSGEAAPWQVVDACFLQLACEKRNKRNIKTNRG